MTKDKAHSGLQTILLAILLVLLGIFASLVVARIQEDRMDVLILKHLEQIEKAEDAGGEFAPERIKRAVSTY